MTNCQTDKKWEKRMIFEAMNIHSFPAYEAVKENLAQAGALKIVRLDKAEKDA